MIRNKYILVAFRLVVGGMFIWAGVSKIIDPLGFAQNIANYRVFPEGISFFLALILPWIEVICGAFLILGIFRSASALLLSGFLVVFLVLIAVTLIRGIDRCNSYKRDRYRLWMLWQPQRKSGLYIDSDGQHLALFLSEYIFFSQSGSDQILIIRV